MDAEEFDIELGNYEVGVTFILPDSKEEWNAEASDDLDVTLYARDLIEDVLRSNGPELVSCARRVMQLDNTLLARREVLVEAMSLEVYQRRRQGLDEPKSHWWWYLDQIPERQCSQCRSPMEARLTGFTLGPDGTAPYAGLIVYVCSRCGEKRLPRLSLEILMEHINEALPPIISDPQFLPEAEMSEPVIVASQALSS